MATFTVKCDKCRKGKAHAGHSWTKKRRRLLGGTVTDTYKCKGVRRAF